MNLTADQALFSSLASDGYTGVSFGITTQGLLAAGYAVKSGGTTQSGAVRSTIAIADTLWHYVAVTIDSTGDIAVYIDGLSAMSPSNAAKTDATAEALISAVQQGTFIGPGNPATAGGCNMADWSIWSVALTAEELVVPPYMSPAPTSPEDTGLVAAFNFLDGQLVDSSGNNVPITGTPPATLVPCLALSSGANAHPQDTIGIAMPAAFTFMAWVARSAGTELKILTAQSGTAAFELEWTDSGITIGRSGMNGNQPESFSFNSASPGAGWHHIAVTTQATSIELYVDGTLADTFQVPDMNVWAHGIAEDVAVGCILGTGSGGLQAMSFWGQCLTQANIQRYMAGADPIPEPYLSASYPLLDDLANATTGNPLATSGDTLQDTQGFETGEMPSGTASAIQQWPGHFRNLTPAKPELMLLDHEQLRGVAERHAKALPNVVTLETLPDHLKGETDWYEQFLDGLPEDQAAELRQAFLRNLHLGHAKQQAGDRTGTFDVESDGPHTVVYYHALDGKHEVYRAALALSPRDDATLKVVLDALAVLFAIFGVKAAVQHFTGAAATWFGPVLNLIAAGVQWASGATASTIASIIKFTFAAGRLVNFIRVCISGMSWRNILFTVLSFVAQLVLMFANPAVALASKIAILAVSLAQLGADIATLVKILQGGTPPRIAQSSTQAP